MQRAIIAALMLAIGASSALAAEPAKLQYVEEKLCSMENAQSLESGFGPWRHSKLPSGREAMGAPGPPRLLNDLQNHVVFFDRKEKKIAFVIDGKPEPYYDGVEELRWTADGKTLIYAAQRDGKWFLVVGGKELTPYESVGHWTFSRDGKKFAYGAIKAGKWIVVCDGKESAAYDDINEWTIQISDGGRLAFVAFTADGKWKQIVDGKEGMESKNAGVFYGKDQEHFAYIATSESESRVVTDGKPGEARSNINSLVVENDRLLFYYPRGNGATAESNAVIDGTELELTHWPIPYIGPAPIAHAIKKGEKTCVLFKGKEGALYDQVTKLKRSSDGAHVAYLAIKDGRWRIVLDDKEGTPFDCPDESEIDFTASGKHWFSKPYGDKNRRIFIDGKQMPDAGEIHYPLVSADGAHYAYFSPTEFKQWQRPGRVVIDGKPGPLYASVAYAVQSDPPEHLLPNAAVKSSFAYLATIDAKTQEQVVVQDGRQHAHYLQVHHDLRFTADGAHLAYTAQSVKGWTHVVDGVEGAFVKEWDHLRSPENDPLTCYFVRDNVLYRGTWK